MHTEQYKFLRGQGHPTAKGYSGTVLFRGLSVSLSPTKNECENIKTNFSTHSLEPKLRRQ